MVNVVIRPLVGFKVSFDLTPLGLNGVGVIPLIDEGNGMINGMVHVALSIEISVHNPAITDYRSAWLDSSM
jgi:hypothetical protein